jgi:hypothetical protein
MAKKSTSAPRVQSTSRTNDTAFQREELRNSGRRVKGRPGVYGGNTRGIGCTV